MVVCCIFSVVFCSGLLSCCWVVGERRGEVILGIGGGGL